MTELPQTQLKVEDFAMLQSKLLWCYQGKPGPGSLPWVTEEKHLYAWWIQKGAVTVKRGVQVIQAEAGQWVFGGPQRRLQQFSPQARILSINFKMEWPWGDSLIDQSWVVKAKEFPRLEKTARDLQRHVGRFFPGVKTRLWDHETGLLPFFELNRYFGAWLLAYLESALKSGVVPSRMARMDPRVRQALRNLNRHSWKFPFREKDLARAVGLSPGHLDRLFVRDLKMTPGVYLQKRRLESACALLSEGSEAVKEIAYDLGFSSPGHFSFWFKNKQGKTPLQFRQERSPD